MLLLSDEILLILWFIPLNALPYALARTKGRRSLRRVRQKQRRTP